MDRSSRHKSNKETLDLNNTLYRKDLTNIYRTFHPTAVEHALFSSAYVTFFRIDHMLDHKTSLNKFKTEITLSIIS